jgi:hypothetical protein
MPITSTSSWIAASMIICGRLVDAEIDHLEAGVAQDHRYDLAAGRVPVEPDHRDDDLDSVSSFHGSTSSWFLPGWSSPAQCRTKGLSIMLKGS